MLFFLRFHVCLNWMEHCWNQRYWVWVEFYPCWEMERKTVSSCHTETKAIRFSFPFLNKDRIQMCIRDSSSSESLHPLSDEYRDFIQKSLDAWCANSGYKDCDDCTVNMLTLSRTLSIPKDELSAYFDQYLKTIFRIGLGDIRFNAAKKMIVLLPNGGRKWLLM